MAYRKYDHTVDYARDLPIESSHVLYYCHGGVQDIAKLEPKGVRQSWFLCVKIYTISCTQLIIAESWISND